MGMLLREGAGFALKSDSGRTYHLDLHRTPVDHVEKRVRVIGRILAGIVEVEGVQPA